MAVNRVTARKALRRSVPASVALLLSSLLFAPQVSRAADSPRPGRYAINDLESQYGLLSVTATTGVFNPAHWNKIAGSGMLSARGLVDGSIEIADITDQTAVVTYTISARDQFGNPYTAGGNASPTFADLDNDGSPELIVGNSAGTLDVREVSFTVASGVALLPITQPMGSIYSSLDVGDNAAPDLVDFDNDGDLDLFVANAAGELLYGENVGSVSAPSTITSLITYTVDISHPGSASYRASMEDLDGDGDVDGIWGAGDGSLTMIENRSAAGSGTILLTITGSNFRTVPAPASPNLVDLDDDADYDIVLSDGNGELGIMENIGANALSGITYTITVTNDGPSDALGSHGGNPSSVLHDMDSDGDLDLFFGTGDGSLVVSENEGTVQAADYLTYTITQFQAPVTAADCSPAIGDIYGDGSSGFLYGGADGLLHMGHGAPTSDGYTITALNAAIGVNPFEGTDYGNNARPALVDIDADGDLDVLVCSDTCDISEGIPFILNEGADHNLAQGGIVTYTISMLTDQPSSGPMILEDADFVDMDDDGDYDMVAKVQGNNNPLYAENTGTGASAVYTGKSDRIMPTPPSPGLDIAIGDLDRDGMPDLVCATNSGPLQTFNLDSLGISIPGGDSVTTVPLGSSSVELAFNVMTGDGAIVRVGKKQDTSNVAPPGGTYVEEYYELDGSALPPFSTVDLTFTYDVANANGLAGDVGFVIEDDGSSLIYHPDSSIGSTVTEVGNSVTVTGATGLSKWYIGGGPSAVKPGWELYQ